MIPEWLWLGSIPVKGLKTLQNLQSCAMYKTKRVSFHQNDTNRAKARLIVKVVNRVTKQINIYSKNLVHIDGKRNDLRIHVMAVNNLQIKLWIN